jgi:6-phosphogluconolactonase
MANVPSDNVRSFATLAELSAQLAQRVVAIAGQAVASHGRCAIALAGGSTPRDLYRRLASPEVIRQIDWTRLHVFWGDERYVPEDDARSNARMARETLLDHVPCPPQNIHPMPTGMHPADDAAIAYERTLREFFGPADPVFDLVLLGLGADGHTASLFPHAPALQETARLVVAITADADPPLRLTLTLPVLTSATTVCVMAAGADKQEALGHVLEPDADADRYPAAALRAAGRRLTWWVARI